MSNIQSKPIRKIFMAFVLIGFGISLILAYVFVIPDAIGHYKNLQKTLLEQNNSFIAYRIKQTLDTRISTMESITKYPFIKTLVLHAGINDSITQKFLETLASETFKKDIYILSFDGTVVYHSGNNENKPANIIDPDDVIKLINTDTPHRIKLIPEQEVIRIAVPIYYNNSREGILVTDASFDIFRNITNQETNNYINVLQGNKSLSWGSVKVPSNASIDYNNVEGYPLRIGIYNDISNIEQKRLELTTTLVISLILSLSISFSLFIFFGKKVIIQPYEYLRKSKQELAKEKKAAEEANAYKNNFIASVSHELRTPMNGIISLSQLLKKHKKNDPDIKYIETIYSSANSLLDLLNDILDLSKAEEKEIHLENECFDIKLACESTYRLFEQTAKEKNTLIQFNMDESLPKLTLGDLHRYQQILRNLISNAVKFTEKGTVSIRLHLENNMIITEVEDTGIGIDLTSNIDIFDKFTQANSSVTRKYGGTGLGLAICKNLVQLMGGEINLESRLGEGSTFYFSIPYQKPNDKQKPVNTKESWTTDIKEDYSNAKVLIVDDNEINRFCMNEMLKEFKITHTIEAENGEDALQILENQNVDLIFMDCEMPVMNGYTATREIRNFERRETANSCIVAMTAHSDISERQKCFDSGMNDYLAKPIENAKIYAILKKWLQPSNDYSVSHKMHEHKESTDAPLFTEERIHNLGLSEENSRELFSKFTKALELFINQNAEDKTLQEWKKDIHKLKGSAATLGCQQLSDVCQSVIDNCTEVDIHTHEEAIKNSAKNTLKAIHKHLKK